MKLTVISDVHVKNTEDNKFVRALKDLNTVAPDHDAIDVVGMQEGYRAFNSFLQKNKLPNAEEFMVMGNHEYFEKYFNKDSNVSDEEYHLLFQRIHPVCISPSRFKKYQRFR